MTKEGNYSMKAVIYTSNMYAASIGILVTMIDGEESQHIVEVSKKVGTASYEYRFDNGTANGITRLEAEATWKIAAENYGATLVPVDKKFMNDNFKGKLKPHQEIRKEERRIQREINSRKSSAEKIGYHQVR